MITRRKLFKNLGAFLGVATVAPSIAFAEPIIDKVAANNAFGSMRWRHLTAEDIEVDFGKDNHEFDSIAYLSFICRKPDETDSELRSRFETRKD